MELSNTVTKQVDTQIQTEQRTAQTQPTLTQKVKAQVEQAQKNENKPLESEKDLRELIDTLNRALDPFNTSIRFGFDNSQSVFYVSVIDANTNDTIRRFPAEQAQTLVGKMNEIVGIIFDEKG